MNREKEKLFDCLLTNSGLSEKRCLELADRLDGKLVVKGGGTKKKEKKKKEVIKEEVVLEDITEPEDEYRDKHLLDEE